jgi:hypothetical protein
MTKEEKIYLWGVAVTKVETIKAINKAFGGIVLTDKDDAKAVITAVNELIGQITEIGDLSDTGLGIPAYFADGKYEQTREWRSSEESN